MLKEQFQKYWHFGQIPLFAIACFIGLILPFLLHGTVGQLFLPVHESIQGTIQEGIVVRNIFVACGFVSVFLPLLGAIFLLFRDRSSSFWAFIMCAGIAIGAIAQMILLFSPGSWSFIMR